MKNGIKSEGFSLAELLVVIVILGILGSLAMPKLFPQKEKAVVAEAVSMLHIIRMGELSYKADTGSFLSLAAGATNSTWNQIGIDNPASGKFNYSVNATAVTATRSTASVPERYSAKKIVLFLENGSWDEASSNHPLKPHN